MQLPGRRAPVITISCPNCGGQVKGAREGQHTACQYCRTELFVPQIGVEPPPHERHVPQAIVHRSESSSGIAGLIVISILVIFVGTLGAIFWFVYQVTEPITNITIPEQPTPIVTPPMATVTPSGTVTMGNAPAGQNPGMQRANCLMGCISKCGDPNKDQMAYATCAQGCTAQCK